MFRRMQTGAVAISLLLGSTSCTSGSPLGPALKVPTVEKRGLLQVFDANASADGVNLRTDAQHPMVAIYVSYVAMIGRGGTAVAYDWEGGKRAWKLDLLPTPRDKVVNPPDDLATRIEPSATDGYDRLGVTANGDFVARTFNWTVVFGYPGAVRWAEVGYRPSVSEHSPNIYLSGDDYLHQSSGSVRRFKWDSEPPGPILAEGHSSNIVASISFQPTEGRAHDLTAFDTATGAVRWTRRGVVDAPLEGGIATSANSVYVLTATGHLEAFDNHTGATRWISRDFEQKTSEGSPSRPEPRLLGVAKDRLAIATTVGQTSVVAIDGATGAVAWRTPLPWERKPRGETNSRSGDASGPGKYVLVSTPEYFHVLNVDDGSVVASNGDVTGYAAMYERTICAPTRTPGSADDHVTCWKVEP